ncbi:MAG: thiamine-phosphate kinase [Flavipsychrobacter sp.]|nr:thiamine-phosphate kinase [Flavipsychrobacter sp.]
MEERTEISSLGEFGLIDRLTMNNETVNAGTILSVGDDAAVIDTFGKQVVVSTDMLVEGVHFDLMYTPLKHLGYKSVAVNLSDIYAMNATPTQITMSLAISSRFSVEALDEFYDGVYAACDRYGVDLVGGDTTTSLKGLVISVTAIGEVTPDTFVTRKDAQKGDLICVSGDLGSAYLGLQLLDRERRIYLEHPGVQPDLGDRAYIVGRLLKPEPRADVIEWLREQQVTPTAMIDVSDGLSSEVMHICRQSNLGAVLYEDKLPIHQEAREMAYEFKLDPTTCALSGGEDYELLFTIKQEDYEKINTQELFSVIGYTTEASEGLHLVTKQGNKHALVAQGWNAFEGKK